jgi:hypothetical protein
MSDFRLPPVPGADALPKWRQNPAYQNLGLSAETIAALDQSELDEATLAAKLRERTEHHRATIYGSNDANAAIEAQHVEQQRIDQLSPDELRDDLQDAIDRHGIALKKVQTADYTLNRAQEGVTIAEVRLARFQNLDERAADYRAMQIRQDVLPGTLPPNLADERRAQHDAQELLDATRRAHVALMLECQSAKAHLETCAQQRDRCCIAIISKYVDDIAIGIEEAAEHLNSLRQQALSISAVWLPLSGVVSQLPVSDRVRNALRRTDQRPPLNEEIKADTRSWFIKLQQDADATIGDQ